jgi:hypothetical protein
VRRELERIEIPGEHDARERAWAVVRAAHAEREPRARQVPWRPLALVAAGAALLAATFSPPGRALVDNVRETIGIADADKALVALPDGGRLLVVSSDGTWIVARDGARRRLGDYDDATWSPFGNFVAATTSDELTALEPDGDVRWKLARTDVRFPRWGGTRFDTRIAYFSRGSLRVVGGDGRGDRLLVRGAAAVAPAWRPGPRHVLAYADGSGRVVTVEADSGRRLWRTRPGGRVAQLEWSTDGRRLLVRRARFVDVLTPEGQPFTGVRIPNGVVTAAAFRPRGHTLAVAYRVGNRTRVLARRLLFAGPGNVDQLAWSPDARWLLVAWPTASEWLFVGTDGRSRVDAVQFDPEDFPRIAGWCCP